MNKKLNQKLKYYQDKIKKNPNSIKSQLRLGMTYISLQKYRDAILSLIWAQALNPNIFETNYQLALAYFFEHDFEKGMQFAKLAQGINPQSTRIKRLYQKLKTEISFKKNKEESIINGLLANIKKNTTKRKFLTTSTLKVKEKIETISHNACDGFCKFCDLKSSCRTYSKRIKFEEKCQQDGTDPHNIDAIINEIKYLIDSPSEYIEEEANALGVGIKLIENSNFENAEKIHQKIIGSSLFRRVNKFTSASANLLDQIFYIIEENPTLGMVLRDEIEKIIHYSHICESKIYQALSILTDKKNVINIEDAFTSLAIVSESLNICKDSLKFISETEEIGWSIEALFFITNLQELHNYVIKKYPQIKAYRNKIIINSTYENK